ncbi:response regulator [bacterium]|uniref:Response regulatory domain-containing protein n=1 Tax=Rubinisphaera brasiliensis (strain ATCC 49424 / DSM 5305 / JCM 21570 / IAM 15109 / NBRC 103401 / IFAM 1448) TaxID=756272 RepID=F0SN02_RUBBR|nr:MULTISPECIES: response regulator [Rubinisphaera]ADY60006.1 hypothetical protein Plabr_2405 [Rubinisphaera brasiliensis DSM 5305]MBB03004.1 hypothetical protein [Planctomyces sp.]MBR9803820.1 response regulator [bacterium]
MAKQVLSVGQCIPDDGSILRFLSSHFDVQVTRSPDKEDALSRIRTTRFDLILVNRKLDADYSEGMDVIKSIQADPDINTTPVMLVSNYADAQEKAVVAGAEQGFGKNDLGDSSLAERLQKFLG